jgi:hypothetical protein
VLSKNFLRLIWLETDHLQILLHIVCSTLSVGLANPDRKSILHLLCEGITLHTPLGAFIAHCAQRLVR